MGGDAFGYYRLDEDHFVIYLIDVSGHGVGAALLSVSVFMNKSESNGPSRLDHLYQYAEKIRSQDNFEDDFTIVEVAFG